MDDRTQCRVALAVTVAAVFLAVLLVALASGCSGEMLEDDLDRFEAPKGHDLWALYCGTPSSGGAPIHWRAVPSPDAPTTCD